MSSPPSLASQRHVEFISKVPSGDDQLTTYLADRDEPCPLCGYNLRNLQTDRCPECGRQLRLTVGLTEPALGAWVSTLVALLLPAGVGVLFVLICTVEFIASGRFPLRELWRIPPAQAFMLLHILGSVPLSGVVLARRRWFLKRSRQAQQGFNFAAWSAVAISILCMIYTIRH